MKWLWVALALLLLAIAAQQITAQLPLERLRPIIERELSEGIGLDVRIAGIPRVKIFPQLELEIEGVRITSQPGRSSRPLLTIGRLGLELRILPLFQRMLVVEALDLHDVELRIEADGQGTWSLHPDLDELDETPSSADGDPIALVIRRLAIHDLEVYFDSDVQEDFADLNVRQLVVESDDLASPLFIQGRGAFGGSAFEIEAETGSLEALLEGSRPFPVEIRISFADTAFQAEGTIGDPDTRSGMNLRFSAKIADPAAYARDLGLELPPLGSLDISGVLVDRDGTLGIQAAASFSLSELPLQVEFELDDDDGSLGIEGDVHFGRPDFFELVIEGDFDDLWRLQDLDARVRLEVGTLETLSVAMARQLPWELPDLGPLEAVGHLVIDGEKLGLEAIDVRLGDSAGTWAQVTGSLGDLLGFRDVELEVRIGAASVRDAAALFGREIPEIGSLAASFSIRDQDGSLGIERATLHVQLPEQFDLRVTGTFDDLVDLEEIAFDVAFEARDLSVIAALAETELSAIGPVSFEGSVRGSAGSLRSRGQLRIRRTVIDGEFSAFLLPGERPALKFQVHSPLVHLPDLLAAPRSSDAPPEDRAGGGFEFGSWWRSHERLPLELLRAFDAEIQFEAKRVTGYESFDLQDLRFAARLERGHLRIDEASADYENGRVSSRFELDVRSVTPKAAFELEAFNVDLTRLMSQLQYHTEYAGMLDLSIDLETEGSTAPEVRSNLRGFFGVMLRNGSIVNQYSKALSFDVLHVSMPSFRPKVNAEAPVHCLLALASIDAGVAEMETLYLEGEKITVTGEGQVDLPNDELALRLTPRLHEPGLVSVAATVDVSGPIGHPIIRPSRRSMVTSALAALYQNAIRPFGALDRMIRGRDRRAFAAAEDPCGLVARQRIRQLKTGEVEPIDLEAAVKN